MKKIILATILLVSAASVKAQTTGTATQTVKLNLSDVIDITFTANNNATGAAVNFTFANVSDYTNGKQSSDYQIKVRSNKKFNVTVKANSAHFTYSGSASPAPSMPVSSVLSMMIAANQTGGSQVSPFSSGSFGSITSSAQNMLTNCNLGNNQWFNVKYKANPGFNYPGGTYTVDVVYTATQP